MRASAETEDKLRLIDRLYLGHGKTEVEDLGKRPVSKSDVDCGSHVGSLIVPLRHESPSFFDHVTSPALGLQEDQWIPQCRSIVIGPQATHDLPVPLFQTYGCGLKPMHPV